MFGPRRLPLIPELTFMKSTRGTAPYLSTGHELLGMNPLFLKVYLRRQLTQ